MKATLKFARLLVLDWFDGPLEAVGEATDGAAYHVELRGDPPISAKSVYRITPLGPSAFRRASELAAERLGPPTDPVWIPQWQIHDPSVREAIERRLEKLLEREADVVGYCRTAELADDHVDVVWLHISDAELAEMLHGEDLWAEVVRLNTEAADSS